VCYLNPEGGGVVVKRVVEKDPASKQEKKVDGSGPAAARKLSPERPVNKANSREERRRERRIRAGGFYYGCVAKSLRNGWFMCSPRLTLGSCWWMVTRTQKKGTRATNVSTRLKQSRIPTEYTQKCNDG
jgi:hypothetical protein